MENRPNSQAMHHQTSESALSTSVPAGMEERSEKRFDWAVSGRAEVGPGSQSGLTFDVYESSLVRQEDKKDIY